MRFLPPTLHGVLDYASVVALVGISLSKYLDSHGAALARRVAFFTLLYSLLTRYRLGVIRILAFPLHLSLDAGSGMAVIVLASSRSSDDARVLWGMRGFGAFEILASLMTKTR